VISPLFLIPPSAIIGMLYFLASIAHSTMDVNCGTPQPVTIRVIHIEPGPTPTLIPSAPARIKS